MYTIVGNDGIAICRVGLNLYQLTKWGRRLATIHPERNYLLFKQPITHTGHVCFYKKLLPFKSKASSKDTFD